jgi:hypothetical protein
MINDEREAHAMVGKPKTAELHPGQRAALLEKAAELISRGQRGAVRLARPA